VIQQKALVPLPAALEAAVQAALDERREVWADPAVERVLIERPETLGPLIAWIEALETVELVPAVVPRPRIAGLALAAGFLAAASLVLLAARLTSPIPHQASHARGPALEVHDFSITVTRTGPTGTTQLVNDNGHLARLGHWTSPGVTRAGEFPRTLRILKTTSRRNGLR
jgi:hypothetical protein